MASGGKRVGAGRKPEGKYSRVNISVSISQEDVYLFEELGEGNVSRGIRNAAEELLLLRIKSRGYVPPGEIENVGSKKRTVAVVPAKVGGHT